MSRSRTAHPDRGGRRGPALLVAVLALAALVAAMVAAVSLDARSRGGGGEHGLGTAPDVVLLAGPLAHQELSWEECTFDEGLAAPLPGADLSNVECATVQVPRDWHDPHPESTWDLRVSRAHNVDPADPRYGTTIIAHPGGPYTSGLSFASTVQAQTPELRPTTNYISFDQRGLGQSSHAPCRYEHDPSEGDLAHVRAIGEACSKDPDVATMTTEQTAYDMDLLRHLLGLEKVTYLGYSYGTWLGTWYGALFAENIERMLLDSAVDGTAESIQTLYDAAHEGRDRQFRLHLMNWMARQDATYALGTDPAAIWERYFSATDSPEAELMARYAWNASGAIVAFSNSGAYPLAAELVAALIAEGEASAGDLDAEESAARVLTSLRSLPEEQRAAALTLLETLATAPDTTPGTVEATYDQVIDFTKCTDGRWVQGEEHWEEFHRETSAVAPFTAQLGLLETPQVCAFWPTDVTRPEISEDFPETLVLQSELDSMTPFEQGRAAGTDLPNTSLIAVDNDSAHGIFPYGTEEVDRPVLDFLRGGERPARTIIAAGKPMPLEERTYESWSPLDGSADHEGAIPRFTDPSVPARTPELADAAG